MQAPIDLRARSSRAARIDHRVRPNNGTNFTNLTSREDDPHLCVEEARGSTADRPWLTGHPSPLGRPALSSDIKPGRQT